MSTEKLYTPAMLAAAVTLADYPPIPGAALRGEARSTTCGSTLEMDLDLSDNASIGGIGMKISACAVGQASAAIFASHAVGRGEGELRTTLADLECWLAGGGALPSWPGMDLVAPARDYPARHGAMLLPWKAALAALSSAQPSR